MFIAGQVRVHRPGIQGLDPMCAIGGSRRAMRARRVYGRIALLTLCRRGLPHVPWCLERLVGSQTLRIDFLRRGAEERIVAENKRTSVVGDPVERRSPKDGA